MNQANKLAYSVAIGIFGFFDGTLSQAQDRQWTYQYNSSGQVVMADGPRTDVDDRTHYSYDSYGNRISATNALGQVSTLGDYNQRGQPRRMVDANGIETRIEYNTRGWILSHTVVAPSGSSTEHAVTRYTYDNEGNLISTLLPDGSSLHHEYDAAQRLVASSNNLGDRIEYSLDYAGNHVAERAYTANGTLFREVNKVYDELNRLIRIVGASGQVTRLGYDPNGNQSLRVDGNGNTTIFATDSLNRASQEEAAHAHTVNYNYDARDNLAQVLDPRSLPTRYTFNGFDELTKLESHDSGVTRNHYDAAGNRISSTDANGISVSFSYDALNRLLTAHYPDTNLNVNYGYDGGTFGAGKLSSVIDASGTTLLDYDHRGNLVFQSRSIDEQELTLGFEYNLADRLTRITYPSGRTVEYSHDAVGRQSSIQTTDSAGSHGIISNSQYLPFGPATSFTFGNGSLTQASFDLDYRLTSLNHGTAINWDYSYDEAGNIVDIANQLDSSGSQQLAYDALNRLGTATGRYGNLSYTYDENGNRLTYSNHNGTDTYTYDVYSNRLLSTNNWEFQYDANGNLIARTSLLDGSRTLYHYDDRNRLAQVVMRDTVNGNEQDTILADYTYNYLGQRTRKKTASQTVHYLYGLRGELLAEVSDDGIPLREYIYFNNRPMAVANANFSYGEPELGPELVLDDTHPGTSGNGNWEQVRKKGAYGDYYHRSQDTGSRYRWHPGQLDSGEYQVYGWWPKTKKHNKAATYTIYHGGQATSINVDQSSQGKQWVALGTFTFSGSGNEYIELSDAGGITAADGIRLVKVTPPPLQIQTEIYYIHGDHLGTPQALTDQNQQVVWRANYRPFGQADIDIATVSNNLRFPGQYFDEETGLHQNYHRDYDPVTGRYSQHDPLGLAGSLNPYGYANFNPHMYTDPYGLAPSWVGPAAVTISTTGGTLVFYPNPLTPPWIRATGLAMVGIGGALEVWDWATAIEEVKKSSNGDIHELRKNIEKINELLESQNMHCE